MNRQSTANRRQAFTLIELLVVISIVSLLMALMLPVLSNSRESARRMECMTRLRSIGTFTEFYLNDNKFVYYYYHSGTAAFRTQYPDWALMRWTTALGYTYKMPGTMYWCPTRALLQHQTRLDAQGPYKGDVSQLSFGWGQPSTQADSPPWYRPSYGLNTKMAFVSQPRTLRPSSTVLMGESRQANSTLEGTSSSGSTSIAPASGNNSIISIHDGQITTNVLWADTHVKTLRADVAGLDGYASYYHPSRLGSQWTQRSAMTSNGNWNAWNHDGNPS